MKQFDENENGKRSENGGSKGNVSEFELSAQSGSGTFPTYFVFLDLPKHIEFRFSDLPLMKEGTKVEFDMNIRNPRDPRRTKRICGLHIISRCVLKCGGKRTGITQYIEWKSIGP